MKSMFVSIEGMHCPSCVELLKEEFSQVNGVHHADVNLKAASGEIFFEGAEPSVDELSKRAAQYGYTVKKKDALSERIASEMSAGRRLRTWALGALTAGGLVAVFLLLQTSGLIEGFAPRAGAGQFALALFTGVVASVSSCFAVVGSLVIAFGGLYGQAQAGARTEGVAAPKPIARAFRANTFFHIGRLVAFFLLGGLLGLLGGSFALSGRALAVVMIVYALAMVIMGLSILGLGRLLNLSGLKMPPFLTRGLNKLKKSTHPLAPALLGAVTFVLPCGFTQSMQVLALGSGGFLNGALLMLLFAIGTTPVLFATGLSASWTRFKGVDFLRKAAGILVIVFAVYTFISAGSLFDFTGNVLVAEPASASPTPTAPSPAPSVVPSVSPSATPSPSPSAAPVKEQTPPTTEIVQTVEMHITYRGFAPAVLKVKAGVPVRWVIWGDEVTGCTNAIVIPSLGIRQAIRKGANTITFTPEKSGRLPYSCWMGMVRGAFEVE
jgi:sulfite exporter TauE/SafE/copper chaperone CopZ/plastocyanin